MLEILCGSSIGSPDSGSTQVVFCCITAKLPLDLKMKYVLDQIDLILANLIGLNMPSSERLDIAYLNQVILPGLDIR